jgi:DNA-binding NarL/FixJ family response regulator
MTDKIIPLPLNPPRHQAWQGILTRRQAEVAEMAAQGYTCPQIAEILVVEEQTIKFHLFCAYKKLGFDNTELSKRVLLARWWWTNVEKTQFELPLSAA